MKLFAYIALAVEIMSSVQGIMMLVAAGPLKGPELFAAVQPSLMGLHQVLPQVTIPDALAQSISQAVADAVNNFHKPSSSNILAS